MVRCYETLIVLRSTWQHYLPCIICTKNIFFKHYPYLNLSPNRFTIYPICSQSRDAQIHHLMKEEYERAESAKKQKEIERYQENVHYQEELERQLEVSLSERPPDLIILACLYAFRFTACLYALRFTVKFSKHLETVTCQCQSLLV